MTAAEVVAALDAEWCGVEEAAKLLRVNRDTCRRWARNGRIPARLFGMHYIIPRAELMPLIPLDSRGWKPGRKPAVTHLWCSWPRRELADCGTAASYARGCRCKACRKANAVRQDRLRSARAARAIPAEIHGKYTTYINWNCRCADCSAAHAVFTANQYTRRKAA